MKMMIMIIVIIFYYPDFCCLSWEKNDQTCYQWFQNSDQKFLSEASNKIVEYVISKKYFNSLPFFL